MKRRAAMEIKLIKETHKKAMSFSDTKSFHAKVIKQLTSDDDITRVINKTINAAIKSVKNSNDDLALLYTKNFLLCKKQMISNDVLRSAYFKAHKNETGKFNIGFFCLHYINATMEASEEDVLAMGALEEKMFEYACQKEIEGDCDIDTEGASWFSDLDEDDKAAEQTEAAIGKNRL